MRCHYEVLGVSFDASAEDIKTAYRKGALTWHPDKNLDRAEAAAEKFKELKDAYDILKDPQARAWYDRNRSSFIRSYQRSNATQQQQQQAQKEAEDDIDLFPYFTSRCFSGYGDGPNGFYGVYEKVFNDIWEAEVRAYDESERTAPDRPPSFGKAKTPYEEVAAFYRYWTSFQTAKGMHHVADPPPSFVASNRMARKKWSSENTKKRNAAKKEFNETVRELARFVRKRDKRVAAHKVEEAKLRAEKQQADELRRQKEATERAERARNFKVAAWAEQAEEAGSSEEVEEEVIVDKLYCPACDKLFRSEGAYSNHERSKKHLENVKVLRAALAAEEAAADLGNVRDNVEETGTKPRESRAASKKVGQLGPSLNQDDDVASAPEDEGGDAASQPSVRSESELDSDEEYDLGAFEEVVQSGVRLSSPETQTQGQERVVLQSDQTREAADEASGRPEQDPEVDLDDLIRHERDGGVQAEAFDDVDDGDSDDGLVPAEYVMRGGGGMLGGGEAEEGPNGEEEEEEGEEEDEDLADDEDASLQRLISSQRPRPQSGEVEEEEEDEEAEVEDSHVQGEEGSGGEAEQAEQEDKMGEKEQAQDKGKGRRRAKKSGKVKQTMPGGGPAQPAVSTATPRGRGGRRGDARARGSTAATVPEEGSTVCAVCALDCGTRNRLFKHLAATGHARYRG